MKRKLKNMRIVMSALVFLGVVFSALMVVGIYLLCYIFRLIPEGELFSVWFMLALLVACNVLGGVLASSVYARITKPMDATIKALHRIAEGDFDIHLESSSNSRQLKELQETINLAAQRLAGIEGMQNDFINMTAHEFKTPVASIMGYARRLKNPALPAETKEEYAGIILEEARKLSSMTTNILLLTRYENTQIVNDRKEYSLDEQIRRCVQALQQEWMKKGIEIEGDFTPVLYCGNEELVNHIWMNLLTNAIQNTPPGGRIFCRVAKEDGEIQVTVQDTGRGISKEGQKHIFEKFYQENPDPKNGGSGLGLSIVKRLVDLNGGRIRVESAPGEGSAFVVGLPDNAAAPQGVS